MRFSHANRAGLAAAAPSTPTLLRATVVLLATVLLLQWFMQPSRAPVASEIAFGCDSFAYLRAAELFERNGPIGGLDTSIRHPDALALTRFAKATGLPPSQWALGVAPHCHHYLPQADRVIAQYPPGTGFLLSLFRHGAAQQQSWIAIIVAIAAASACCALRGSVASLLLIAVVLAATLQLLRAPFAWMSFSIPWSLALLPAATLAALRLERASRVPALVLGLACGLLLLVRLPNVFVVAGLGVLAALQTRLWCAQGWRDHRRNALLALVVFVVTGPVLLGWSNWINTGSALRTTYGALDAEGPVLSWTLLQTNAAYYFQTSPAAAAVDCSLLLLLFGGLKALDGNASLRNAVLAGAVTAFLSIAFFLTHRITAPYYLVPSCVLTAFAVAFGWAESGPHARGTTPAWSYALVIGTLALFANASMRAPAAPAFSASLPPRLLADDAIVWADHSSGSLLYYNDKYAAKFPFLFGCSRYALLAAIHAAGRPQYFVMDSDLMRDQVGAVAETEPVGSYDFVARFPVMQLTALKPRPAGCP